jgi:hypothetical protein
METRCVIVEVQTEFLNTYFDELRLQSVTFATAPSLPANHGFLGS